MSSAWQKKKWLPKHKSQQKLLEIILKFNWKVNEFQLTQLLTQILSFISILAKQNPVAAWQDGEMPLPSQSVSFRSRSEQATGTIISSPCTRTPHR